MGLTGVTMSASQGKYFLAWELEIVVCIENYCRHMKHKAGNLGVDLLLIDTGDLHDGNGLSDATTPNGAVTNPIFENIDYDLLTIGTAWVFRIDAFRLTTCR